ncbi:hypothetical protein Daus18300_004847 [Diaporthe australafricana]|uniref:Uncharacterized protein n=1 Tax=Diaporthe australafricana TaxID=127596 RepID=A0ABR3X5Z2_9PEZI
MADGSGEEVARTLLTVRIGCLETQLKDRLTPLLRREMRNIIQTHSDALKLPSFAEHIDLLESLDNLHEQFVEHWEKLHKDYASYTMLILNLVQLELFLTASLSHDYLRVPSRPDEWALEAAPLITAHREGKTDENDRKYYEDVVLPLQEMGVNVSHVENKTCLAADGKQTKRPDGYVMYLVQAREWEKLAETLLNDRQLAIDFFDHHSLGSGSYNVDTCRRVHARIDKLEHIYFESLSSPTDFKLSRHALEVSAGKVEVVYSDGTPAAPQFEKTPSKIPRLGHARNILSAVAGSLKALGTSPTPGSRANTAALGNRHDEKTPLVDSKEI